jgi:hypothetical protein
MGLNGASDRHDLSGDPHASNSGQGLLEPDEEARCIKFSLESFKIEILWLAN